MSLGPAGLAGEAAAAVSSLGWKAGEEGRTFEAELSFPPDAEVLAGHFPGHPIVPAVYLIEALLAAGAQLEPALGALQAVRQAKFLSQIEPGVPVALSALVLPSAEGFELEAELTLAGARAALLSLRCARRAPDPRASA